MKTVVTKRQVIKALRTEPLRGGTYFHTDSKEKFKNNTGCAVCAVGGLLDEAVGKRMSAEELDGIACDLVRRPTMGDFINKLNEENCYDKYGYYIHGVEEINFRSVKRDVSKIVEIAKLSVKRKQPLSALSMLFEALYSKRSYRRKNRIANQKLRNVLIDFVKKNFPNKLTIDSDLGRDY